MVMIGHEIIEDKTSLPPGVVVSMLSRSERKPICRPSRELSPTLGDGLRAQAAALCGEVISRSCLPAMASWDRSM